ncbi:Asp-tRNAAsn/Glu-tRNAGln amidotransferase A subunit or related amidase [Geosmithia morbida]|uniref:Asp-tRNAAsn/Glu-tRNAGln amidotransferase A subunit or related amidase n=1 Tax=Geosmithia morbida TaxID=1094350 RepID=A0A9P4YX66_9HYPO|nr:Asp-tRNAAsn/Glu-tRNAGln amidotransferase A subunit or related amidase [Geosmithia morbida]KAF4124733.1 Asp-tRNAAsn/Glu-tRNAGln amidotransferase A subunit or related amidase [Geosmithia morbida]
MSLNIDRLFGVRDYVTVVTGGSSGLGFMISKGLVENGAKVYLVALPTEPIEMRVEELNEIGKSSGGTAHGYPCNVMDKDAIARLAEYVGGRESHIDLLVSNAGIRRDPPVPCDVLSASLKDLQASMWSSRHSDWADTFCVNTTAHYFLSVAMLPLLAAASERDVGGGVSGRNEGRGAIVITSSCASMHNVTNVDLTSYASSKAATDHLVKLLAAKFRNFYVRVAGINPGFVPSNMNPVGQEGNMFSALFDKVPAKRAGRDEDIAGTVLYLASRAGIARQQSSFLGSDATLNFKMDLSWSKWETLQLANPIDLVANALRDDTRSDFNFENFKRLAAELNIHVSDDGDSDAYVRLLWSFEGVLKHIGDGTDYAHPALTPQPVTNGSRHFWKPEAEGDNPFNAWSHRCDLRSQNATSGILAGRTLAIKDNISVGGLPITLGAPPELVSEKSAYPISQIDATVVSRLLAAGGIVKGTSTCECFCASPLSFTSASGPVHNPHLHGYTSGGSSSGSCTLVAAHSMPPSGAGRGDTAELAIGSDQAGSVRIPASYCGVYGLKPTFGLVPYTGAASMSPMIDHLGPIASDLGGVAALLEVMAGYDGIDSRMTPESPLLGQVKPYRQILQDFESQLVSDAYIDRPWRVGILTESFSVAGVSDEVAATVRRAATEAFKAAGAEVVNVSVPMHREGPIVWTAATRPSMSRWLCQGKPDGHLSYVPAHLEARWPPSQEVYKSLTETNPALANIIFSEQFAQKFAPPGLEAKAHRKVFELRAAYDEALKDVDVLVTPCAPTIAMPNSQRVDGEGEPVPIMKRLEAAVGVTSNTCPFNVTGHPAMNVPCGFSSPPGHPNARLPIGMQLVGQRWCDDTVIMAAALFNKGQKMISTS